MAPAGSAVIWSMANEYMAHDPKGAPGQAVEEWTNNMKFLLLIATVATILVLFVLLVQWAFNAFLSPVFSLPQIDFVQAVAATILIILLRGSVSTTKTQTNARLR